MMRSILVALLVAMLTFSPATACHYCGGYGGGGYYTSGGYYGGWSDGGCDGCGSDYYESGYDSCCGGEVVVSEGCGDCGCGGGGCDGCDGYAGCEADGATVDDGEPPMEAPEPPASTTGEHSLDREPHAVGSRPCLATVSALPSATETEMHAMPPVEPTTEAPAPLPETTHPATNANPGRRADDSSRCDAGRFVQHAFD